MYVSYPTIGGPVANKKNTNASQEACVQSQTDRRNTLTSGHRACQGCGEALAARAVLDVAYSVTKGNIVVVNATGCLEVFSCVYPENAWNIPWLHSLFANAPSVASGVASAMRVSGKSKVRVIAQGGDGATTDIGMSALSGMFDRNDDVLYVCYDNQAYMNTGVQRSSSTPPMTRTATTFPYGSYLGNDVKSGKNLPEIAIAHNIPYVATASIAHMADLERKVTKAINIHGARYIQVHVPCPLGWGTQTSDTIKIARLAIDCGLFPLFEAEGPVVKTSFIIQNPVPVEEYLRPQRRYAHLFAKNASPDAIAHMQKLADENIRKYKLLGESVHE
jgi:pyruvate ferredoxin oxidoreductase beta subunit